MCRAAIALALTARSLLRDENVLIHLLCQEIHCYNIKEGLSDHGWIFQDYTGITASFLYTTEKLCFPMYSYMRSRNKVCIGGDLLDESSLFPRRDRGLSHVICVFGMLRDRL